MPSDRKHVFNPEAADPGEDWPSLDRFIDQYRHSRRNTWWGIAITLATILTMLAAMCGVLWWASPAHAHKAPSGWEYPEGCCEQSHCRPIPCEAINEQADGFHYLGMTFKDTQWKQSGDTECHACFGTNAHDSNEHFPYCIFTPRKPTT